MSAVRCGVASGREIRYRLASDQTGVLPFATRRPGDRRPRRALSELYATHESFAAIVWH
jgi:hypothetical protein